MLQKSWKKTLFEHNKEKKPLLRLVIAIRMLLIAGVSILFIPSIFAAEEWNADSLHMHGVLSESACYLDMESAWQDVDLDQGRVGRLSEMINTGFPVVMQMKLQGCLFGPVRNLAGPTGKSQPTVAVSFTGPVEINSPKIVELNYE